MRKLEDKQIHQKGQQEDSAWASEMKEDTLVEWATATTFKITNTHFQNEEGREEMDMEKP